MADSQVANRWGNILEFQDFDFDHTERARGRIRLGDQDSLSARWRSTSTRRPAAKCCILKLGERGIITYRAPSHEVRSFFTVDSFADRVVDAVGAGDALLSYAALSMVATKSNMIGSHSRARSRQPWLASTTATPCEARKTSSRSSTRWKSASRFE